MLDRLAQMGVARDAHPHQKADVLVGLVKVGVGL